MQLRIINTLFLALITSMACSLRADQPVGASSNVDYETDVAPILKRYCAGCHNDTDMEGDFSLSSLQSLQKGTPEGGPVVVAGSAEKSLLFQLIIGKEEPAMPPEDEPQLSDEQKEIIRAWIEKGLAAGPMTPRLVSNAPALKPALPRHQYVSAAAATKEWLAVGKLGRVEMFDRDGGKPTAAISDLPGKVNVLKLHPDGQQLIAGSGVAGLGGQIVWIDTVENKIVKRWDAHSDAIYALAVSADGRWLASGSYDRRIIIWDVGSGSIKHELSGHNGAIYDLDFDPTSRVLASASADQTVK